MRGAAIMLAPCSAPHGTLGELIGYVAQIGVPAQVERTRRCSRRATGVVDRIGVATLRLARHVWSVLVWRSAAVGDQNRFSSLAALHLDRRSRLSTLFAIRALGQPTRRQACPHALGAVGDRAPWVGARASSSLVCPRAVWRRPVATRRAMHRLKPMQELREIALHRRTMAVNSSCRSRPSCRDPAPTSSRHDRSARLSWMFGSSRLRRRVRNR